MPLSSKTLDYTLKLLFVAIFVLVCVIFTSVLTFSNSTSNSSATKFTGDRCPTYRTVTKHVDPIAVPRSVEALPVGSDSEPSENALLPEPQQAHQFPASEPILMNAPPPTSARSKWHGSIRDNLQWTPLTERRDPKHIDSGIFPLNRNRKPIIKASEFTFVTTANDRYYSELLHFLGKCHRFAPSHRIILYDLGMTEEQLVVVRQLYRVHIVPREEWQSAALQDFGPAMHAKKAYISPTELPSHINDPKSFAWKPLVMWDALNRLKVGAMIYLDAGVELVRYPGYMVELMEKRGYVYVAQEGRTTNGLCCGSIGELTVDETFQYLGLNKADYADKLMSAGGIQAYREVQPDEGGQVVDAINLVLRPVAECGWDINCMAPPGSNIDNHRQDQSVFSIFVHKAKLYIETDHALWGNGMSTLQLKTPAEYERATILRRRYRSGMWERGHADEYIRRLKIAIVLSFDVNNLAGLEGTLRKFEEMIPCHKVRQQSGEPWFRQDEGVKPVDTGLIFDLILYANYLDGAVKSRYQELISDHLVNSRHCFNEIILADAGVEGLEPIHEQRMRFERLWRHPAISLQLRGYSHFFTVDHNSMILRSGWLDGLLDLIGEHTPPHVRRLFASSKSDRVTQPLAMDEPEVNEQDGHTPLDYYYSGSWWMIGGTYQGRVRQQIYLPTRIHHMALFHVTMNSALFMRYLFETIPHDQSAGSDYDIAILLYGTKDELNQNSGLNWEERQLINGLHRHRFIVSDYVQDCGADLGRLKEFQWLIVDHTQTYFAYQPTPAEYQHSIQVLTTLPNGPNGPLKSTQYVCPSPPPCPIEECSHRGASALESSSAISTETIFICPNVTTLELDTELAVEPIRLTHLRADRSEANSTLNGITKMSLIDPTISPLIDLSRIELLLLLILIALLVLMMLHIVNYFHPLASLRDKQHVKQFD